MSGCGLLENPALFSGIDVPKIDLCIDYLDFARKFLPKGYQPIVKHLFNIMGSDALKARTDVRDAINNFRFTNPADYRVNEVPLRAALQSMADEHPVPLSEAARKDFDRIEALQESFLGKRKREDASEDLEGVESRL